MLEYLDAVTTLFPKRDGWEYASREEFVKRHGIHIPAGSKTLTEDEEKYLHELFRVMHRPFPAKACFENTTKLFWEASHRSFGAGMNIQYGEGFATHFIPTHHAVMLLNNKPIDVTWREDMMHGNLIKAPKLLLKRVKYNMESFDYYMVPFSLEELNKELLGQGVYGILNASMFKEERL